MSEQHLGCVKGSWDTCFLSFETSRYCSSLLCISVAVSESEVSLSFSLLMSDWLFLSGYMENDLFLMLKNLGQDLKLAFCIKLCQNIISIHFKSANLGKFLCIRSLNVSFAS